ncbi:hypothetical protein [Actinoplanes sp. DH11]|uniref:hypothetical protein n=1 Tax=Actinoplanes sp. DH11 TaxID=2857011 RepID=UPI001E6116D7|nr:hypothetical protein [Actinoplanes sp. DH11]
MEHRYSDESEPGWYTGRRYATDPETSGSHPVADSPYDSGVRHRTGEVFRLPEQREPVMPEPEARTAHEAVRIPIRGPEYPPVRPAGTPPTSAPPASASPFTSAATPAATPFTSAATPFGPAATPATPAVPAAPDPADPMAPLGEPTTMVPAVAPGRPAEGVYRTRRPVTSIVLAAVAGVLLVPALRLLLSVTFAADATARGIVPAALLTLGLALTGVGLFAVGGGAPSRDAWLRAPLAYLPAGLILLIAAGLAVA